MIFFILPSLVAQDDIKTYFLVMGDYQMPDDAKEKASDHLKQLLCDSLENNLSFIDSLDLPQLKMVSSSDQLLRIYTWCFNLQDASCSYGGIVVYKGKVTALHHNGLPLEENEKYNADDWCGGVYYELVAVQKKGETLYTLLAWDGNNGMSYRKIIEVLSFDRKGRPVFGESLFFDCPNKRRIILEYSFKMSLLLTYNADKKGIVTNALQSNDSRFDGISAYTGTSDAFNIYRFEKEMWVLYEEVDLRMNKKDSKKMRERSSEASSGL